MARVNRKIVPRTVRPVEWNGDGDPLPRLELPQDASGRGRPTSAKTLGEFEGARFVVLLGEAGSGKTTEFERAAEGCEDAEYVTARAFLNSEPSLRPEWKDKTLFIDGLDETRAGAGKPQEPLDGILARLEALRWPPARIACRPAAWLATNDFKAITSRPGYEHPQVLHLNPLADHHVQEILASRAPGSANGFVEEARHHGLHGILHNPLTLELLAKAFAWDGAWPKNRTETFEQACRQLVSEVNHEHAAATRFARGPVTETDALDAAGRMAALFLLADQNGIAWDRTDVADPDGLLLIDDLRGCRPDALRKALDSRLFSAAAPGTFVPVHAHVAEYLAARHLARAIKRGARLIRVLTLVVLGDGIPTSLRGLAAWLAALCPAARQALVDADPVAVVTYGDATSFNDQEKEYLLDRLAEQDDPDPWAFSGVSLGGLVSPRTMDRLRDWMRTDDRSPTTQRGVTILLNAMADAPERCGPEVESTDLLAVARDATWGPFVRYMALNAATHLPQGPGHVEAQRQMIEDIRDGEVPDQHGDLMTALLRNLYPDHISPQDVWDYVAPEPRPAFGHGPVSIRPALADVLVDQSGAADCRALLRARPPRIRGDNSITRLTWRLLAKALSAGADAAIWYDWIEMAAYDPRVHTWHHPHPEPAAAKFQARLAEHPVLQKALLLEFFARNRGRKHFAYEAMGFCRLVFGQGTPPKFKEWCLERAREMWTTHEDAARWLLLSAVESRRRAKPSGDWLPDALDWIGDHPTLVAELRVVAEHDKKAHRQTLRYRTRRSEPQPSLQAQISKHRDALLQGEGPVPLIEELGRTYFASNAHHDPALEPLVADHRSDGTDVDKEVREQAVRQIGDDPRAKFLDALANDEEATNAALEALARVPFRNDGTSLAEIKKMDRGGHFSGWGLPFLAGVDVMERNGDNISDVLGERVEVALWFYFTTMLPPGGLPRWFAGLLESHASLVAKIFVDVHSNRSQEGGGDHLLRLADDDRYQEVAHLALPGLLKTFQAKGNLSQALALQLVLVAAIRHMPQEVAVWARDRIAVQRMNGAQRAVWLAAGVAVAPTEFLGRAVAFVESPARGRQVRMKQLVDMLWYIWESEGRKLWRDATVAPADVAALVRLLGSMHPSFSYGVGHTTGCLGARGEDRGGGLVGHLIGVLAADARRMAGHELNKLADDSSLRAWRLILQDARERQVVIQRDAEHPARSVAEVEGVLVGGLPSSDADLTAVVVDCLTAIGIRQGHEATANWRSCWTTTRVRSAELSAPSKADSNCVAAVLDALVAVLPAGLDARLDTNCAADRRSVIQVSHRNHSVSIEIVTSSNRDLWQLPPRDSLNGHHTRSGRSGYRIYLVLWFGWNALAPPMPPPTGTPPKCADELARRLGESTRTDVKLVVIDASRSWMTQRRHTYSQHGDN